MSKLLMATGLLASVVLYTACDPADRKINGKYILFADGGSRRLIGNNIIENRNNIYPNVTDIVYNDRFILLQQVPDRVLCKNLLGEDLYSIFYFYSNFLDDNAQNKRWDGLKGDSVIFNIFRSKGASTKHTSQDIQISLNVADSFLDYDKYYRKICSNDTNYWIIFSPADQLIGPLSKKEYLLKRKDLNIPDDLYLRER